MDSVALGVQVFLAVVFATAGGAKLLDLSGSRRALVDFGLPERVASPAGVLLPLAELGTAVALLVEPSARIGALAALVLLLAFLAGIANALRRGQAPDCHCFGQIHSAPAGRGTLYRNGILALLAAFLAVRGQGPPIDEWVSARDGAELVAVGSSIAAVGLAALSLILWLRSRDMTRELAEAREEVDQLPPGLPIGAPAPDFAFPTLDGETLALESLCARGRPLILVFMSPDCAGCKMLFPDLGRWQATLADRVTIAVITIGGEETNRPPFQEHGITDVLLQDGVQAMADYRVVATPSAVMVTREGRIGSAPAGGAVAVEPLIRVALRQQESAAPSTAA